MYIKNISEYLKKHDIKPSYQRIRIFEYLVTYKTHPTVDEIYRALNDEIPTLSKTTVYNTLNIFIEKGIAILITIEENETRYDANVKLHGHFKCEICQKIYDIQIPIKNMEFEELKDFEVKDTQIYFKGICPNCSNK